VPGVGLLALPVLAALAVITALGAGVWLAALNVEYRDVRYVLPFVVQFWLFATPVVYPSSLLPERWRVVAGLNPMAGVVEGFRWSLLGPQPSTTLLAASAVVSLVLLVTGVFYFHRVEERFADLV
jgi:lipopolysaccharide transport system permease protein